MYFLNVALPERWRFFSARARWCVRCSPCGTQIAWLGYDRGAMNVFVAPLVEPEAARVVSPFRRGTIASLRWSPKSTHVIIERDAKGEEREQIYGIDVATRRIVPLAPDGDARAFVMWVSDDQPRELLVASDARDGRHFDLFVVNIASGKRHEVLRNEHYATVVADRAFRPRLAIDDQDRWWDLTGNQRRSFASMKISDEPLELDQHNRFLYVRSFDGSLVEIDLENDRRSVLVSGDDHDPYAPDRREVETVLFRAGRAQAVSFTGPRQSWMVIDRDVERDLETLRSLDGGEIYVTGRSADDRIWIVAIDSDADGVRYFVYERASRTARPLFDHNPDLERVLLCRMRPVAIRANDGLRMVGYLTLPRFVKGRRPPKPLPMVLLVHGGPHARDRWGLNPDHQWLASRGYAVLSVNFRGSTGFGAQLRVLGRREWGGAMQRDLETAMDWAVERGIADPKRVAIMGASYGGYAALAGLTFTPLRYACAIAFAAPTNLVGTVLQGRTSTSRRGDRYWIGDAFTAKGRQELLARSPTEFVENVCRPLLIAHGANDKRVPRQESDRFVRSMKRLEKEVTYVMFFGEGHGFSRRENEIGFVAIVEAFLAHHLGGKWQPFEGDLKPIDLAVLAGTDRIPGLRAALPPPRALGGDFS